MLKPFILISICILLMGFTRLPMGINITCRQAGLIALTFDDGITKNSLHLLEILDQEQVKATFFIVGETLVERHGLETLQRLSDQGHLIGNHTWTHVYLSKLPEKRIEEEILATQNGIDNIKKNSLKYVRPPYGAINQSVYDKLTAMGYSVVMWNMDLKDWNSRKTKQHIWSYYQCLIAKADPTKESFILLLHERKSTLDLLPHLIYLARQKGFEFVTIDQCLNPI
jgi:peptidoglycan/xylan/chitin deacetylase (PgdA/CDA1 family)